MDMSELFNEFYNITHLKGGKKIQYVNWKLIVLFEAGKLVFPARYLSICIQLFFSHFSLGNPTEYKTSFFPFLSMKISVHQILVFPIF